MARNPSWILRLSFPKKTTGPSQGLYFFFFVLIAFCGNELPYDFK
jgi:hypothetical protein